LIAFFIVAVVVPFASHATESAQYISLLPAVPGLEAPDPHISWTLEPNAAGIKSVLNVSFAIPEKSPDTEGQSALEYRIEIDSMMRVVQEYIVGTQDAVEQILPIEELADGIHTIALTVRDFQGKNHTRKREFKLDMRPRVNVFVEPNDETLFDPKITFSFFGQRNDLVGMADIYLDDRLIKTANILETQNNKPVTLSELLGFQIHTADLAPGNHLVTITAQGLNASSNSHILCLTGSIVLPEITVHRSDTGKFEHLEVIFPATSNPIIGSAEIHLNHSVILAVRTDQTRLAITRADLLGALEKHGQKIGDHVTMLLSTRSANQVENWQEFSFQ